MWDIWFASCWATIVKYEKNKEFKFYQILDMYI